MKKVIFLFAFVIGCLTINAQVTIENLLSPPFPAALTVSPDGNRIAWIFNNKGERNIFAAEAPSFQERKLTNYSGDDGQEITSLSFTPDNSKIIFVRGGDPNNNGEFPNPNNLQTEVDQALWVVNYDGSGLRKIARGSYPKISPDGKQVAFLSSNQLWIVRLDSTKEAIKLFQSRGSQNSIRWSPDGSRIAFISYRNDHSFLGIYELRSKAITFFDASVDLDHHPVWSPDGKYIAYIRTPFVHSLSPFEPKREGYPWSIRKVEISSGKASEIWRAKQGEGSVLHESILVVDNFLWWIDDKIVFPWEHDGWQHLYAVSISGGDAQLLSPGDGEVENVCISLDRKSLIINTNIGDIDRRHLWRIIPSTGKTEQITSGTGIEWNAVETSQGVVCFRSGATSPAWIVLAQGKEQFKSLALSLFPKEFPGSSLIVPEAVTITATDGMKIPCQIFRPKNHKVGEKHPAVIYLHGGSRRQMLLGFNYTKYYHNAYALNQYLAINGYIVLSVNYRSGIGYGMEFREALDYGAAGVSEYRDIEGAGLYLTQRDDVHAGRIGIWGGSYGGYLTAMALAKSSGLFACGVDIHGVHDWNARLSDSFYSYQIDKKENFTKKAIESSPINFIDTWESPVLLIHGDDDRNVSFNQTVSIVEALRKRGVYFEQLIFPDEVHTFLLYKNWVSAYSASIGFIDRNLKK